jgi:ADP-ribose pyrophosphatase YjhB (NUDIX family)
VHIKKEGVMGNSHFSAVFIHNFDWKNLMVLVVQDERFSEVKIPGGMGEIVSGNCRYETPVETMHREAISETGVQVLEAKIVRIERMPDRKSNNRYIHEKYFFLATKVSALPALDAPPRQIREINASDNSEERLSCYWLPIRVFAKRLYKGQKDAFGAVLGRLNRMETDFSTEYKDLLGQFTEPKYSGIV